MKKIIKTKTMFALIMGALLTTQSIQTTSGDPTGCVFGAVCGAGCGIGLISSFYLMITCKEYIHSTCQPCKEDYELLKQQRAAHESEKTGWLSQEAALNAAIALKKQEIAILEEPLNSTQTESQPSQRWSLKSLFSCPR